ncbi:MAG TPA: hypothetical protein VGV17_04145 [Bosea sp. (in: a-proteobacteria)]|jgi:hypothetical protein|uniref:hypothetical protein n=1 Tax=Bosea sp. (in: a-proteobacteria) TaxID=1871050 RepID=UPI002DDCFC08|nr:hypothetical protein [Bosea sp. (in: a-proteobacteria)]HEV2552938.1 hypothetical protein [Bosea sp. (in: a-proteobacteria)]
MPSFTSSSRTVLVTAALALAIYAAVIALWRPTIHLYPDQDASNLARAERVLIGEGDPHTVILGSSLGVRIPDDWLPAGWLNASLGGKGAATGLALLRASSMRPRRILVETNTFDLGPDLAFVQDAQGPIPLALRTWVPGLRAEYRPINLLLSLAGRARGGAHAHRGSGSLAEACLSLQAQVQGDIVSAEIVGREVARLTARPVPSGLVARMVDWRAALRAEQERGVEVILFEWPVDPEVMRSPRAAAIRTTVAETLPTLRFLRLDGEGLATEDGLHLAPVSARHAACALLHAVGG